MRAPDVADAPILALVTRDGFVESVHRGHVAVVGADGTIHGALGDPELEVYPRSSLKPFQALAAIELLADGGMTLDTPATAIACASHVGSSDHQVEAARILAAAGLDEDALRCPEAFPSDRVTLADSPAPTRLAHNCSGKHAAFLAAQVAVGGDPAAYLAGDGRVQRLVTERLRDACGTNLAGPGVDGCGAPAWRVGLHGMARAFARLAGATGRDPLAPIAAAMRAMPHLVGGPDTDDTRLMLSDGRIVAKRGAEAFFGVGFVGADGIPLGIAGKIADGGARATGPVMGSLLSGCGMQVDVDVIAPVVLGGGLPHGSVAASREVSDLASSVV